GVNANADDVVGLNGFGVDLLQCFVDQVRDTEVLRRGGRKDKEPPRRDDSDSKRTLAWINKMNGHGLLPESGSGLPGSGQRGRRSACLRCLDARSAGSDLQREVVDAQGRTEKGRTVGD